MIRRILSLIIIHHVKANGKTAKVSTAKKKLQAGETSHFKTPLASLYLQILSWRIC
jgi:hypothetical protein